MGRCVQVLCTSCPVLHKGLEHVWISVLAGVPESVPHRCRGAVTTAHHSGYRINFSNALLSYRCAWGHTLAHRAKRRDVTLGWKPGESAWFNLTLSGSLYHCPHHDGQRCPRGNLCHQPDAVGWSRASGDQ